MASYSDGSEYGSSAKRPRLEPTTVGTDASLVAGAFPARCTSTGPLADPPEVISPDCDSGYEASTLESLPTPTHQSGDFEGLPQTPSHPDVSQDSIDVDDDDNVSIISELSGLSELSGQDWKPIGGSMTWIQKQMQNGVDPRTLLIDLGVQLDQIPQFVDDVTLWKLIINMLSEPPRRHKLRHVNTLDDVVRLLKGAQKIIVLTGAGVSVSCGIPDFRSRDGIYSRLAIDFPDLPDPQAMFDISYFAQDPRPFYKFARDIYPGKFQPSPCHRFIKQLERQNKLLRNYTQNIDTLEKVAEIERVIECHGSFATATCTKCEHKVTADVIREIVLSQNIPVCEKCQPTIGPAISINDFRDREVGSMRDLVSAGIMKPDIVFFGEGLPDSFHDAMSADKNNCDLLVVIGSSLKVRPVALIPSSLPANVPQILINREPLPHCHFDVELLGDCDVIINHLCHMLGASWENCIYQPEMLRETLHLLPWNTDGAEKKRKSAKRLASSRGNTSNNSSLYECDHQKSINTDVDEVPGGGKQRHLSVDSARDSGIGDNSNFTDTESTEQGELKRIDDHSGRDSFLNNYELELSSNGFTESKDVAEPSSSGSTVTTETNTFAKLLDDGSERTTVPQSDEATLGSADDMQGLWQPKQKRSITERLPANSYYLVQHSRYVFPGAELYFDPDEKCAYLDSSSGSSDSDSDNELDTPDTSF